MVVTGRKSSASLATTGTQWAGKMLMQAVFDGASKHGCSRVEWTTDRDNSGAQAFYATLRLPTEPSKVFYRVEDIGTGFQFPRAGESAS
ncbi:MAG: GNAT family N-acetyltransferase [Streptosporangiaceae bacterium]